MDLRKSPFPGMDPYLEAKWPEVHASLIVYARNQLNRQLPPDLQTNIEQTLAVCVDEDFSHSVRPDLHIVDESASTPQREVSGIAVAEPLIVPRTGRPERHLEIVDASGRVIAVIELLSPWNKTGQRARMRYAKKQSDYLASGVNLIEIDLVRQGEYVLAAPESELPKAIRTSYMVCVYRDIRPDQIEIYLASLRERLPNIPVPLRPGEPDAVLQLQPLIDDCYHDGRYYQTNYQKDPEPPLSPDDNQWLDSLLRNRGLRASAQK